MRHQREGLGRPASLAALGHQAGSLEHDRRLVREDPREPHVLPGPQAVAPTDFEDAGRPVSAEQGKRQDHGPVGRAHDSPLAERSAHGVVVRGQLGDFPDGTRREPLKIGRHLDGVEPAAVGAEQSPQSVHDALADFLTVRGDVSLVEGAGHEFTERGQLFFDRDLRRSVPPDGI